MLKFFGSKFGSNAQPQGNQSAGLSAIEAQYEREMQANLAALAERRRKTRRKRSVMDWAEYWPLAMGIVISCFVPQLHKLVVPYRPWGMWVVFPFAALIDRPEVGLSQGLASTLPLMIMYAQFPLEGLLARFGLRGRVTVLRVLGQVLFLHVMVFVELWLVSGPWGKR
ncbi:MAG TPA: hypothetical protein VGT08_03970 [Terracidiphilus sp.]|nr:hypothetical protein [Terracidiphilus sp.]